MLKNIFLKTLFEKRWMTFWWTFAVFLLILSIVALFPMFKDSLGDFNNAPDELKSLIGDTNAYTTITGWLNFQVFDQMVFAGIILGIIIGGGILAGEESKGTLQSLLALPVKRSAVYWQKFAAIAVITGVVTITLFFGSLIGIAMIGESVGIGPVFLATVAAFLVTLFFTALTYSVGAITGRRGIAGAAVGLFAFASFMLTSLANGISALKYPDYLSPFHYYNKPSPLTDEFQILDLLILLAASLVFLAIGHRIFTRRDIYQR
jgi:ABC-2 type transport system permease protein